MALSDVLEFAQNHHFSGDDVIMHANSKDEEVEAPNRLQVAQGQAFFSATGQTLRLKKLQEKLKSSATENLASADKAPLVRDELKKKRRRKETDVPLTSGDNWYNIPNTKMNPEIEETFKLLQMRPYLFKDTHFKASKKWKVPAFFGVGTVVNDPLDFYSSRVPRKQRKKTLAEELLSDEGLQSRALKKVEEKQKAARSNVKFKRLKASRNAKNKKARQKFSHK